MRPKQDQSNLAERLNSALNQLHSLRLQHHQQKGQLTLEMHQLMEENDRLKTKNKQLRRHRETTNHNQSESNYENEQSINKIRHYMARMQESASQMCQIAAQCRILDEQIEKASAQIERNMNKAVNGVQKHICELVRRWGAGEALRIDNQRLQIENKKLVQLTTELQGNFKETDRLLKQLTVSKGDVTPKNRGTYCEGQSGRIRSKGSQDKGSQVTFLENKITKLTQRFRQLEQENHTIKNIHQRTMKKLEKIQTRQETPATEKEQIQEERQRWLSKSESMYGEMRQLKKELFLSEQNEKKVKEELNRCLEIYNQWEQERDAKIVEITQLKEGINTYLLKIEELEEKMAYKQEQLDGLRERLQVSEGQKQKIVSVYQLEVQQLNDQLFKKQDLIAQMESIINRQHNKHQQVKRQLAQRTQGQKSKEEDILKAQKQIDQLKQILAAKQGKIQSHQDKLKTLSQQLESQRHSHKVYEEESSKTIGRLEQQKQELAGIMQQFKEQYHSAHKQYIKAESDLRSLKDQFRDIQLQLRDIIGANNSQQLWTMLASLRDKYKTTSDQCKALRNAQMRIFEQMESKEEDLREMVQELRQKNVDIQTKNTVLEQLQLRNVAVEKENINLKQQINDLEKPNEFQIRINDLLSENKQLKMVNIQLEEKINLKRLEANNETGYAKKQSNQQNEMPRYGTTSPIQKQQKEMQVNFYTRIVQELQEEVYLLKQSNMELKTELQNIKKQVDILSQQTMVLKQKNEQLTVERDQLREKEEQRERERILEQKDTHDFQQEGTQTEQSIVEVQKINAQIQEFRKRLADQLGFNDKLQQLLAQKEQIIAEKDQNYLQLSQQFQKVKHNLQILCYQKEDLKAQITNYQQKQVQSAKWFEEIQKQKQKYASQLAQIEQLMEDLKQSDMESQQLKQQLSIIQQENKRYATSIVQLQSQNQILKAEIQKSKFNQSQQTNIRQLKNSLQGLQRQNEIQYEEGLVEKKKSVLLEQKSKQLEEQIHKIRVQLSQKQEQIIRLNSMMNNLKTQIQQQSQNTQIARLTMSIQCLQQEQSELTEELNHRSEKIAQLKQKFQSQLLAKETFEQTYNDKCRELQLLQKQNEHLKTQIKRINKEKVMAENETARYKYNFEEQQSVHKMRESQMSLKNSQNNEQLIRDLQKQIKSLQSTNSFLQDQASQSRAKDMYSSNHSSREDLPMEKLKGQLKTKTMSIESLQRQLKSKIEDYSKLERKAESLNDELSLERKRVKNFEQLYQNIQAKKMRLINGSDLE